MYERHGLTTNARDLHEAGSLASESGGCNRLTTILSSRLFIFVVRNELTKS